MIVLKKDNEDKEIRTRQFMLEQQLRYLNYDMNTLENSILPNLKPQPLEWAFIIHNKDCDENKKRIEPHIHLVLKFKNPQSLNRLAEKLDVEPQYITKWDGRINNAYSYLLHETEEAIKKYHYKSSEVHASFNFAAKIASIRASDHLISIKEGEEKYANGEITLDQLRFQVSTYDFALHLSEIKSITKELEFRKHEKWVKNAMKNNLKLIVHWFWGEAGTGKTTQADEETAGKDVARLGASNDYFQNYSGEKIIIINDLRPNEFRWSDLLTMLDPYQYDKQGPRRYRNTYLNLEEIYITTPYSPYEFYKKMNSIDDRTIDTFKQLSRRISDERHFFFDSNGERKVKIVKSDDDGGKG